MKGHIPRERVDAHLRALRLFWVSTTRPDGRPHTVPVWFTWDGHTLYFATHAASQKATNLRHQAEGIVHASDGDDGIVLEGEAIMVTDEAEMQRVDRDRGRRMSTHRPVPATRSWWKAPYSIESVRGT